MELQAAEIFLWGTEERDYKGSFQFLICRGKEIIALTFIIRMGPTLMLIRMKRIYEVVKRMSQVAPCWQGAGSSTMEPVLGQHASKCNETLPCTAAGSKPVFFPMAVHI